MCKVYGRVRILWAAIRVSYSAWTPNAPHDAVTRGAGWLASSTGYACKYRAQSPPASRPGPANRTVSQPHEHDKDTFFMYNTETRASLASN